ncbi:MAG: VWA domain-containing protein [Anaerolineales bacterium]|nr:VWA domain-containing protein [Anaerolineales bacterium]
MRFFDDWHTRRRIRSAGQALILIVLTFFGLLFFLGLMVDLGQIFLAKGYLRRAADAASLAAAAQFRENRTIVEMTKAAEEVALMNGVAPTTILVETCQSTGGTDAYLCPEPGEMPKKLVRVTVVMKYPMTFLVLLGINDVTLQEVSVSEAAAMDVVLVIDVSESMAWLGTTPEQRDPSMCNPPMDNCTPMREAKDAALQFIDRLLNKPAADEEDRLAIVTFANGWQGGERGTRVLPLDGGTTGWTSDNANAKNWVNGINVYDPGVAYINNGSPLPDPVPIHPVRMYTATNEFQGMVCLRTLVAADPSSDPKAEAISACGTTNIGGGLLMAGNQFAKAKRPDALWVVVLLTDGMANATFATRQDLGMGLPDEAIVLPGGSDPDYDSVIKTEVIPNFPLGFCPSGTWDGPSVDPAFSYCQDHDAKNYNSPTSGSYDADDFARDMGRFVGCPAVVASPATGCGSTKGQGAVIFAIGLGDEIDRRDPNNFAYGGELLRFIAAIGDDGNPDTNLCASEPDYKKNCGNYYYAQEGTDLGPVFEAIYSRIFTRLTA